MLKTAHRSSSGVLNCICSLWFICQCGDRPLSSLGNGQLPHGYINQLQEAGGGRGDWMELAQDRDRWRALVGTVRDFRVP
jgi:hypothetical protein